jgi:hypothetical protein
MRVAARNPFLKTTVQVIFTFIGSPQIPKGMEFSSMVTAAVQTRPPKEAAHQVALNANRYASGECMLQD